LFITHSFNSIWGPHNPAGGRGAPPPVPGRAAGRAVYITPPRCYYPP
jgi:hypothetical protein